MENSKAKKILWLILILPFVLTLLNLRYFWLQCFNPSETSSPESMVVYFAERAARGQSIFLDYHRPPYIPMPYTPFYHWLIGKAGGYFGLNREGIIVSGRIFTLGCAVLISLLLFIRARSEEEEIPLAASGGLFFLSSYVLWPWAVTNRPDILGALLSLAGFLLYTQFAKSPMRWLSIPLFLFAFFTKQSFVCAPGAVFLWLIWEKKWKEAIFLSSSCALLTLIILFAMDRFSGGLSTMNLIDPNLAAPETFQNFRLVTFRFFQVSPLPILIAVAGLVFKGLRRPESIYFLLSLAFAIFSSSKLGSNLNYFIEPLAAGCLLVPVGLGSMISQPSPQRAFLVAAFVVLLIPSINFMAHSIQTLHFNDEEPIRQRVLEEKGLIITDNPHFALISRQPFLLEPLLLSYMEKAGKWSSQGIVEMMRKHEIELIVLTLPVENALSWQGFKRLPAAVLAAIQKYYRLEQKLNGYYVYVPKKDF
jgi:hypothetical protein